jgi:hypothetical protein
MTQVTANQLRAFLAQTGWTTVGEDAIGDSWVLPNDDDAPAILVPRDIEGPSFPALLDAAVSRLLWVIGLTEHELLDQVITTFTDTLEVRIDDPTTLAGRIPLDRGLQLAQSLRAVVMNGARLQFAGGRIAHRGNLTAAARDVMNRLELVPPSAGSFRFEVQAPSHHQLAFDAGVLPTDAVHETLAAALRALEATRETIEAGVPDNADELDDAVCRGVSTNLVKAVHSLDTQSSALRVEFRARWSRPDPDAPQVVALDSRHFSQLPRLKAVLSYFDPRANFNLSGWIKEVAADALALDLPLAGTVVVETKIDGRRRDVRVELAGELLRVAGAGVGQRFLDADGTLERIGRNWYLSGARNVRFPDT